MKSRFKLTNFIGWLIALVLVLIGFVLLTIHKQSESASASRAVTQARGAVLEEVALIHDELAAPGTRTTVKTELDVIRGSMDWSDAPSPVPALVKTDEYDVYINVSREFLLYYFEKMGYTPENIDSGETLAIPPLLTVSIKKGWADGENIQYRRSIFYRVLLPLVLNENRAVLRERAELLAILESRGSDGAFTEAQSDWIRQLTYSYGVIEEGSRNRLDEDQIRELIDRLDMVPPSLALAQAAHESGYATTRFTHSDNALFGQWDWTEHAITPRQQRREMANDGARSFDHPISSVRAYIRFLNTLPAFAGFRNERAAQRGASEGRIIFDSQKLAETLTSYSGRGSEYPDELIKTIESNRLGQADKFRLMEGKSVYFHR